MAKAVNTRHFEKQTSTYLRAIDKTLVLFLTRWRGAEFELEAGAADNVCTYRRTVWVSQHDCIMRPHWRV